MRTDDARSASPDSEQIEPAGAKPLRRNSVSVEQIQDESLHAQMSKKRNLTVPLFYLHNNFPSPMGEDRNLFELAKI